MTNRSQTPCRQPISQPIWGIQDAAGAKNTSRTCSTSGPKRQGKDPKHPHSIPLRHSLVHVIPRLKLMWCLCLEWCRLRGHAPCEVNYGQAIANGWWNADCGSDQSSIHRRVPQSRGRRRHTREEVSSRDAMISIARMLKAAMNELTQADDVLALWPGGNVGANVAKTDQGAS